MEIQGTNNVYRDAGHAVQNAAPPPPANEQAPPPKDPPPESSSQSSNGVGGSVDVSA